MSRRAAEPLNYVASKMALHSVIAPSAKLQNTGPLLKLYKLSWLGGSSVVSKDILFSWLGGSALKATDEPPSRRAT